jgi:hypothetical protein
VLQTGTGYEKLQSPNYRRVEQWESDHLTTLRMLTADEREAILLAATILRARSVAAATPPTDTNVITLHVVP